MRTIAVVPSAGSGRRLGSSCEKPFVSLGGSPLVSYALSRLESSEYIDSIVVAVKSVCIKRFENLIKRYKFKKITDIVVGGKTRFESVKNCLERIRDVYDIVLIHDGARPFLEESLIKDSIRLANKYGGCVVAVPEVDTVKFTDRNLFVRRTLDRVCVYRSQTPQTFKRDVIKKAYANTGDRYDITDDASLVEILGKKVKILKGSYRNIKITTEDDLRWAEYYLKTSKKR